MATLKKYWQINKRWKHFLRFFVKARLWNADAEIYTIVRGSLDSYGWLWKSTELFLLHCLQGEGVVYEINLCPLFQNNKSKHNRCQKFNHRNFFPTRAAVNNQWRQRHLSSLYTIIELCSYRQTAGISPYLSKLWGLMEILYVLLIGAITNKQHILLFNWPNLLSNVIHGSFFWDLESYNERIWKD